jgi:predicted transcriptional regulator
MDARDTLIFSIINRIAGTNVNMNPEQELQSRIEELRPVKTGSTATEAANAAKIGEGLPHSGKVEENDAKIHAEQVVETGYSEFLAQEKQRISELKQYAQDADPNVRFNALEALNSLLGEAERDFFVPFLENQPASIVTLCAVAVSRAPDFAEKYLALVENSLQMVAFSGDDSDRLAVLECIAALQRETWIELAEVVLFSLISAPKEVVRKATDTLRSWALVSPRANQLLESFLTSERQFDSWSLSYNEDSLLESWDFPDVLRVTLESGTMDEKVAVLRKILSDHVLPTDEDATLKILKVHLKSETNTVLLSQLILCVTRLSVADEWPGLEPFLHHESPEVVKTTVKALSALKDMRILRFVEPLLTEVKDLSKLEIAGSAFPLLVKRHEAAGIMLLNAMIGFGEQTDDLFSYCLQSWEEPAIKSCEKIISLISAKMSFRKAQAIAGFLSSHPGWSRKLLHISLSSIPDNICDIFTGGSLNMVCEENMNSGGSSQKDSSKKLSSIETIKGSLNSFWKMIKSD